MVFEDWEEDIEEEETFESFEEARQAYENNGTEIHQNYEYINAKVTFSAPFGMTEMSAGVKRCDDDLQQYKGTCVVEKSSAHHSRKQKGIL